MAMTGFASKSKSANGAIYKSQGQARSESEACRPWIAKLKGPVALKGRNSRDISALQASSVGAYCNQGRRASRLPLAIIFRAFSATLPWRLYPRLWRSVSTFEASDYDA